MDCNTLSLLACEILTALSIVANIGSDESDIDFINLSIKLISFSAICKRNFNVSCLPLFRPISYILSSPQYILRKL